MKTSAAMAGLLTLAFGFGGGLLMASTTPASAAACAAGAYSTYNPQNPGVGGSITCTIDNLSFSNFSFTGTAGGGANVPTAASINIIPITTPGNEGFTFNPGFIEANGASQDVEVNFEVTALNGAKITDLGIGFNGVASGTGSATSFSEQYCTGGFGTCNNIFAVTNPPPVLSQEINIPATSTLFVVKDVGATAGTGGSASISAFANTFSQTEVPIPGALPLFATGLVGLWGLRRKRSKQSAAAA
jgi:hypothetical protein